jgi:hypothetical protein
MFQKSLSMILITILASVTRRAKMVFHMRPVLPRLIAGLVCTVCFMNQAAAAKLPVSKQIQHLRPGTAIQVHTTDGRTLDGKLISTSGTAFKLLQQDQQKPVAIECADVDSVSPIGKPPNGRWKRLGTALMVGGFLATTGIAIATAGTIY